MTTIMVTVEGPLALVYGRLGESKPTDVARAVWTLVKAQKAQIVVLSAIEQNPEAVSNWLKVHNLKGADKVETMLPPHNLAPAAWKADIVRRYRASGNHVDLFIDADPAACAAVLERGTPTALFLAPSFAQPEWRPKTKVGVAAWSTLVEEVEAQREAASTNPLSIEES